MAGEAVGSLYYELNIDDSKLSSQLDTGDKQVQQFGNSVSLAGDNLKDTLNKTAAGLAVAGAGLTLISKNATDFTVDLVKNSKELGREIGVSTEDASRLTAALERMGISTEQASTTFGIFSKNISASTQASETNKLAVQKLQLQIEDTQRSIADTTAEIKKNGDSTGDLGAKLKTLNNSLLTQQAQLKQNADGFAQLGIDTKDASGNQKDFNTILFEVADKFKGLPNGVDKTSLALQLFGRSGKDMIPILNLGSAGIQDLEKKADDLGLTLNANTITKVNAFIQSQKNLKEETDALKISIGTATTPVLTGFNSALNGVLTSLINANGPVKDITIGFLAFGGPVLAGAAAILSFTANLDQSLPIIIAVKNAVFSMTVLTISAWAAAVVADLALIVEAARAVTGAFEAINNAKIAQANADVSNQQVRRELNDLAKNGTPAQQTRAKAALAAGVGLNAAGTDSWKGGPTWINEQGPEIVDLPSGTRIIPHDLSKQMANNSSGGGTIFNIGQINNAQDESYVMRRLDRSQQLEGMGLTPAR